jgi:hypothetical protein
MSVDGIRQFRPWVPFAGRAAHLFERTRFVTAAPPAHTDPARDSPPTTREPGTGTPTIDDQSVEWRILQAITELTSRTGRPPTYREVLAYTGIRSHRSLSDGLNELVRTGRLARLSGARNLIVVGPRHPAATD